MNPIFKRILCAFGLAVAVALAGHADARLSADPGQDLGAAESGSQWVNYQVFEGLQTHVDGEKVSDGASTNGQNTTVNEGDRISVRPLGYDVFPSGASLSATTTGIATMHTFRKRDGSSVLLRAASSTLEWYDRAGASWETLKSGYTSDDFGFADNNVNTDQVSYTYFGNAREPFSRWSGAVTSLNGALTGVGVTVTVDSTDGFTTSTGSIILCGEERTYSSMTATTFTVTATVPTCADNRGVAQAVTEFSGSTYPRGNIYLFADNRLFVSGVTSSPQVVYFSAYGTTTNFGTLASLVSDSTDASAGLFNLAEGGGGVTAMVMDEGSIYIFKRAIVYKATLSDSVYVIQPLKTFDQKSQSSGAINKRSTFVTSNGVFFITPDRQIMYLQRVAQVDYPQVVAISDIIKPTTDTIEFASSTGIVYRDKAFFAAKSEPGLAANDTVLAYNIRTGAWDTPIIGWSVGDFAIYQDSSQEQLYFGDGRTRNSYVTTGLPLDGEYEVAASWRSKQYTFGLPHALKSIENVFVEGYIAPNSSLTISLLLDEDGFTQRYTTTLDGEESAYVYDSTEFNVFGLSPFGTRRFGSNSDETGKKKFRIYLGKDFRQVPFHNAQVEFGSEGENQQWEVTGYGFLVRQMPVPEKRELFKSFR